MEDNSVVENDGEWLKEHALNDTMLKTLNFALTNFSKLNIEDLVILAQSCPTWSV